MIRLQWVSRRGAVGAIVAAAVVLAALGYFYRAPAPLRYTSDAYVWQRVWTPALAHSLTTVGPQLGTLHVLAAQMTPRDATVETTPDWALLQRLDKPLLPVIRVDGQLLQFQGPQAIVADVQRVLARWSSRSMKIAGIEIDHDCARARLGAYAQWLAELRRALPPSLPITITVLPDWLESPDFVMLAASADKLVLQVHAVRDPEQGLFDAADALRWQRRLSQLTSKPYRVALPAYGVRISRAADGTPQSVRSEVNTLDGPGLHPIELSASPRAVAAFLATLATQGSSGLDGVVWFRVPSADDSRSWSLSTWMAVMAGKELQSQLVAEAERVGAHNDGRHVGVDLYVSNRGSLDASLPRVLRLPDGCREADGVDGYRVSRNAGKLELRGQHDRILPANRRVRIGWAVCDSLPGPLKIDAIDDA